MMYDHFIPRQILVDNPINHGILANISVETLQYKCN